MIVKYHPKVQSEDLARLDRSTTIRIGRSIEQRLLVDPARTGQFLRQGLSGCRKFRVGDYRIIYEFDGRQVTVLAIGHRKDIYKRIIKRIG